MHFELCRDDRDRIDTLCYLLKAHFLFEKGEFTLNANDKQQILDAVTAENGEIESMMVLLDKIEGKLGASISDPASVKDVVDFIGLERAKIRAAIQAIPDPDAVPAPAPAQEPVPAPAPAPAPVEPAPAVPAAPVAEAPAAPAAEAPAAPEAPAQQ